MNRFFLRQLINSAKDHVITLTRHQATELLEVLDYAEDLVFQLQWVCIPAVDGDLWICPDCKWPRTVGHTEDCGLDALLTRLEEYPPTPARMVPA
jgi:hypothetical protein